MQVSRGDVLEVVHELLSGDLTREAAALWAGKRHHERTADPLVEEALDVLTLVDARHVSEDGQPLGYLFDFEELEALRPGLEEDPT